MGKFQRFNIPEELIHICGRPCILRKQVNADYLVLLLADESEMGSAGRIYELAAERTDADFAFAAVELTNEECVPLKAEQVKTERGIASRYSPDKEKCGVFFEDGPNRIFPSQGSCLPLGEKVDEEYFMHENCRGAFRLLEFLEDRFIPEIKEQLNLSEDIRIVLSGHGMAGLFAIWAGHMTDTFYAVSAISPAPLPLWWHDFSRGYSPLTEKISVSYGADELTPFENKKDTKLGAFPVIEYTFLKYNNERRVNQALHEGGHNYNTELYQAEEISVCLGNFGGFFIDEEKLRCYMPRPGATKAEIPSGVVKIYPDAFRDCTELTEVIIPEGVRYAAYGSFQGCTSLRKIVIPESLDVIGDNAFAGTQWLKEQTGDFVIINGALIEYKGHDREVHVPEGVRSIEVPTFTDKKGIEVIYFPGSLRIFEKGAFCGCDDLREIRIPKPNKKLKIGRIGEDIPQLKRLVLEDRKFFIEGLFLYTEEEMRRRQEQQKRHKAEEIQRIEEEKRRMEEERQRARAQKQEGEYLMSLEDVELDEDPKERRKRDESVVIFTVSLRIGSCAPKDIAQLFKKLTLFGHATFEPFKKGIERLNKETYYDYVCELLKEDKPYQTYHVKGRRNDSNSELDMKVFPTTNIVCIAGTIGGADLDLIRETEDIITEFAGSHTIISASLRTQAEKNFNEPNSLKTAKLYHPELKEVKMKDGRIEEGQFPAQVSCEDGVFLGCCYEMWFGEDMNEYMDIKLLRSFGQYYYRNELENSTLRVWMYNWVYSFDDPISRDVLKSFRKHTKCDEVIRCHEERIQKLRNEKGMVTYEIQQGRFEHGGIRLLKTYLDENNEHVPKCNAVKVWVAEKGADGKTLYKEILPLDKAELIGKQQPAPEESSPPDIDEVLAWVAEELPPQPCRRFSIKRGKTTRFSSKLGGLPYFPKAMAFPKDSKGDPMRLLVQVNYSELPRPQLEGFPEKGILQIFIPNDHDMFGMNDEDLTSQEDFRVIYHAEILDESLLITSEDLPEYEDSYGDFPFEGEYRLVPRAPDVMQPTFSDYRMEEVFVKSYNMRASPEDMITKPLEEIGEEVYNSICERNGEPEAFMGGYPYFVQEDPRAYDERLQDCDTVLFELGSIMDDENDIDIMFGDMGTATFLIPKDSLKELDLSRVLYNYDCG